MVKIRLRRMGNKGRPFYRVVVAKSTAGRNGAFVETIGTYDPIAQPKVINIDGGRALHWLMEGAQPTETTAYLLNKVGVLEQFFAQRPKSKADYKFLDKRTAAISKKSAIEAVAPETKAPPAAETPVAQAPAEDAPAAEPADEPAVEPVAEAPAAAEEPVAEVTAPTDEPAVDAAPAE